MQNKIAFLILAAGESKRLGRRKQTILLGQSTNLIQRLVDTANSIPELETFVVLGAFKQDILNQFDSEHISVIDNRDWKSGIGKSISVGIKKIKKKDHMGVIISVVDQPFLNENVLRKLVDSIDRSKEQIIVSSYDKGAGPPSFFHHKYYEELSLLTGDIGAKPIVKKYADKVEFIDFPRGSFDIDSEEDLERYKNLEKYH